MTRSPSGRDNGTVKKKPLKIKKEYPFQFFIYDFRLFNTYTTLDESIGFSRTPQQTSSESEQNYFELHSIIAQNDCLSARCKRGH